MSTASMRSGSLSAADDEQSSGSKAVRWLLILLGLAFAAVLFAWLMGWMRFTTDPRVVEIQKIQEEAREKFTANGGPQTLEDAQATVAAMGTIREKIDALPPQLKLLAGSRAQNVFRSTMETRINAYFSLPPDQRRAELDRQIKQEDLLRKAWETTQANSPANGSGATNNSVAGGGSGQGGGGSGQSGGQGGSGQAGSGQAGGDGGGSPRGSGPPRGGPPHGGSEEDRNRWRKKMIDTTSPEQRAQYVEYRRAMEARRSQLGTPSNGPR